MSNVLKHAYPIIFADDTTLFVSSTNIENALTLLNEDIYLLVEWFKANKLSLNLSKTHFILFTTSLHVRNLEVTFKIDSHNIERVYNTKFLGVFIDDKLSWNVHIKHVCLKLRKSLGIIRKVSGILDTLTLINLYYTMFFPYLYYCHLVWGKSSNFLLDRVLRLQKRAIRVICGTHWQAHTQLLFIENRIIRVNDLYVYLLALFTFKFVNNMLPLSFVNNIKINVNSLNSNQNNRHTIAQLPLCRTNYRKNSLFFQCPKLCNDLIYPLNLPPNISYFKFKKLMKNISL